MRIGGGAAEGILGAGGFACGAGRDCAGGGVACGCGFCCVCGRFCACGAACDGSVLVASGFVLPFVMDGAEFGTPIARTCPTLPAFSAPGGTAPRRIGTISRFTVCPGRGIPATPLVGAVGLGLVIVVGTVGPAVLFGGLGIPNPLGALITVGIVCQP